MNIQQAVMEEVKRCIDAIHHKTGTTIEVSRVEWSSRMTRVWGKATLASFNGKRQYVITLSSAVFKEDSTALRKTVAHEVAHLADFQLFNNWGHGATWRNIMVRFLGCDANRLVSEEEKQEVGFEPTRRKVIKYVYSCGCRTHNMSSQAHTKIEQRGAKFQCNACRNILQFTNQTTRA